MLTKIQVSFANLNRTQKVFVGIMIPFALLLFFIPFIHFLDKLDGEYYSDMMVSVFDFKQTWWGWTLYVIFICILEAALFTNNNKSTKK